MAYDETLAVRIRTLLVHRKGMNEKKMFGGVGFLLNGNMCVAVWKDSLIVRLEPADAATLLAEPHVRPFDITGKPMKGWLMIEREGLAGDDLKTWLDRGLKFVRKLPPK